MARKSIEDTHRSQHPEVRKTNVNAKKRVTHTTSVHRLVLRIQAFREENSCSDPESRIAAQFALDLNVDELLHDWALGPHSALAVRGRRRSFRGQQRALSIDAEGHSEPGGLPL